MGEGPALTVTLLLLGYAVVLVTAGATVLRRARWTRRAPRLAIVAWYVLSVSAVGAVLLAALGIAVDAAREGPARPCDAPATWSCSPTAAGAPALVALAVALLLVLRVAWCVSRVYAAARGRRHQQLDALAVLGRADDRLGVTVVEHTVPAAYCLPGRVVVTTAALDALDDEGLTAVIAHERAHLRQRHHLLRMTAQALAEAFPHVPGFAVARDEIGRLAELAADDSAARRSGRLTVAAALLTLAEASPVPARAPALTAGGTTAAARARRLIAGERPLGRVRVLLGLTAAALVLAAPVAAITTTTPPPSAGCCTTTHPTHT
jgi:beta-lactamase regulating signal transducer with metallopeptidase domain